MTAPSRAPSGLLPERGRKRSQLWILAALLSAIGLWLALWRVIDFSSGTSLGITSGTSGNAEEAGARITDSMSPDLQAPDGGRTRPKESPPPVVPTEKAPEVEAKIRLYGSLLDARDRTPLTSACSIRIVDEEWEERSLLTQGSGGYEFADLHPGWWEVTVEGPTLQTLRTRVNLVPDEGEKRVDLLLAPAFVVKVRVVGNEGEDLQMSARSGHLTIGGLRQEMVREATSFAERLAARGFPESMDLSVVATTLEPGRWLEETSKPGRSVGVFLTRRPNRVGMALSDRSTEKLVDLGYAEDTDVRGARRIEYRPSLRLPDGSDLAELPPDYCGILELSEPPPAFASLVLHDLVVGTVPIAPGADQVSFSLSRSELRKLPGRVCLKVVDAETDASPEGTRIQIDTESLGELGTKEEGNGSVSFRNVLPGPATLRIAAPDREMIAERIRVQPGATTDLGTYRMQRFSLIQAQVIDDEGKPARITFNVFPLDRYEATRETLAKRFFRSSGEGELKIDSVGHGRYLIVANEEDWITAPALADTTFWQKDRLEIRVSKGTSVALRLRADPPPAAHLAIRTRAGLPVADGKCRGREPIRFLLAPGSYSAELYEGETWLWSEGLAVGTEPVRQFLPR